MSYKPDSEDSAIEQPTIALFAELGWETLNCYQESLGAATPLGRETTAEVILPHRLRAAIEKLNPGLSSAAVDLAVWEIAADRSTMSPARANQAVYKLLKDGVKVTFRPEDDKDQEETTETVRLIDWTTPSTTTSYSPRSSGSPATTATSAPISSVSLTASRSSSSN
ncbi:MAG: type site-specific deoxyribonuclease, HsdR family [Bryobacterales bacterium]|nr:type site-specific deoxyribonuclease, HsdR family [Bryobacterales bacterium]